MSYGYLTSRMSDEEEAALRRRINENLVAIRSGKYRKEPKEKLTELQRASAEEIQSGFIVLERRRLRKELHRILVRPMPTPQHVEYAEDLQDQVDDYDAVLEPYSDRELKRFVRLWNKSRKAKYVLRP